MKRKIGTGLLAVLMLVAMAVPVLAVDRPTSDKSGIWDLNIFDSSKYTVDPLTADGSAVTSQSGFYPNAEKVRVIATAVDESFYLIMAQNNQEVPTQDNLVYIDQQTGAEQTATFTVYPSSLVSDQEYFIYISSSATGGERTQIASFKYYQPYILGDVDRDNVISTNDALVVLRVVAHLDTLEGTASMAADADKDGIISTNDALYILQAVAHVREL